MANQAMMLPEDFNGASPLMPKQYATYQEVRKPILLPAIDINQSHWKNPFDKLNAIRKM